MDECQNMNFKNNGASIKCPQIDKNELRFEKIEKDLNNIGKKLSESVGILKDEFREELDSLSKEFTELKTDYIISKTTMFETIKKFESIPEVIISLEKTIIGINNSIQNINLKVDSLDIKISKTAQEIETVDGKGKFDIIPWMITLIPSLITGGLVFLIMKLFV